MPISLDNFAVVGPLLATGAGALVVLILDLLLPSRQAHGWWLAASLLAVVLSAWYALGIWPATGTTLEVFGGALAADRFGMVFVWLTLAAVLGTLLLSLSRAEEDLSGYLALVLWAALGMMTMALAGNLMIIFLGLELLSLALYVLVAFKPGYDVAREAALKYFVLGSFAAGLLLFGFAFIYGATGSMNLADIAAWVEGRTTVQAAGALPLYWKAGVALAVVGFAFKLALVPFHIWAPDVYEGAPTAVTAFMSVGTKAAAFVALVRLLLAVMPAGAADAARWLLPLGVAAAISMILGSVAAIRQTNIKRIMAYSGIAHAGYLLMSLPGLVNDGIGAGVYYLLAYLLMNMGVFAAVIWLDQQGEDGADLGTYGGLFYRHPVLAWGLAVCLFALAGLPPTGGFAGKFLLAVAAARSGAWYLLGALILATGVSAYVYLRILTVMVRKQDTAPRARHVVGSGIPAAGGVAPLVEAGPLQLPRALVSGAAAAVLAVAALGSILLGLFPSAIVQAMLTLLP